ncbi:acyltransferase family protein [Staphylococcus simiae]|uniref:Probable poly-beta-1,6-N-acetyl-D-glucosamine export protein n=1 Tax=Staphylococcus simiae CCM 7213 = CCUG 51256 TaxID=911238 RepID=G5JJ25_9STAP|nr:acyltransferase family protein [Staphylococcus simiae]EHJ07812.1 intercellular adhesion protein C [Staphylococcus simiae CCM 7213 = CCUG 51256]PNZ12850.1 adhesion protein [Staphylococcus simiae]SNV82564.1 intercellular adhesion protein C [Staphylococcus simiae]
MKVYTGVIFWMRAIACLSIVIIHSITTTFSKMHHVHFGVPIRLFELTLMFSTPLFVFISEFLLAKNYGSKIKEGFFKSRLLYLGIPYVVINLALSFFYHRPHSFTQYLEYVFQTMFHGGAVTYFIIIIFQFYILHWLFAKYLYGLHPIKIITYSIIITSLYWAIRTFIPVPSHPILATIWGREGWMIFVGWLSYFLLGFYIGIYYEAFMNKIKNYTWHIIIGLLLSILFLFTNYLLHISDWVESKRYDMPFYVTMVILMFFLLSSYFKYVPKFIIFISNYSFCIYLVHFFFVHRIGLLSQHPIKNIIFNTIITLVLSICLSYILNLFKFGKFVVGSIGKIKYEDVYKSYLNKQID